MLRLVLANPIHFSLRDINLTLGSCPPGDTRLAGSCGSWGSSGLKSECAGYFSAELLCFVTPY